MGRSSASPVIPSRVCQPTLSEGDRFFRDGITRTILNISNSGLTVEFTTSRGPGTPSRKFYGKRAAFLSWVKKAQRVKDDITYLANEDRGEEE